MSGVISWYRETEAGHEDSPCHVGEREQQKRAAAEDVDCPDGGLQGKDKGCETVLSQAVEPWRLVLFIQLRDFLEYREGPEFK